MQTQCVTWEDDVSALLEEQCVECHGPDAPEGSYDLSRYTSALGSGSDGEPNVVAGDPDASEILRVLDPEEADAAHRVEEDLRELLQRWIDHCEAALRRSAIHPPGILNPRDPDFHGELLAELSWQFDECTSCHGDDFGGGGAEASCLTCHQEGPTDCTTCHGVSLRRQGAHAAHVGVDGADVSFDACTKCHPTPEAYTDEGHIFLDEPGGELDPPPAEIAFGERARMTLDGASRQEDPSWNPSTETCNAVYCHGDTLDDPAASLTRPRWQVPPEDQAACGTCHGIPPEDHGQDDCVRCHSQVVDRERNIIDERLHMDGMTQIGPPGSEGCPRCHGTEQSAAPPPDLEGRDGPTLPSVGAHRAHLEPPFHYSSPIACEACHRVPERVNAAGHIDTALPAEVFPDAILDGSLAAAGGADPVYNRRSTSCSDVYCHGGGSVFADDDTDMLRRTLPWNDPDVSRIGCGDCHGVPPGDQTHETVTSLQQCDDCHDSVGPFGNILFSGPDGAQTSRHMDGVVDVE